MDIVCVDYDATCLPHNFPNTCGVPFDGLKETLQFFRDHDWKIYMWTSRAWSGWGEESRNKYVAEMECWLKEHEIPYDAVTSEKVPAHFYIDDKAVRCDAATNPEWWKEFLIWLKSYPRFQETMND